MIDWLLVKTVLTFVLPIVCVGGFYVGWINAKYKN